MKRIKSKSIIVAGVAFLMVAVLIVGCAPKGVAPPEEEEVPTLKVVAAVPLTGPHAEAGTYEMWRAYMYGMKWIDEVENGFEAGGKRYKIDYSMWIDSKGEVPLTVAQYKRGLAAGMLIFWSHSSHEIGALKELSERYGVPQLCYGSSKVFYDPPGCAFGMQESYPGQQVTTLKWFKENIWKEERAPRLGKLMWDVAIGRAVDFPEQDKYIEEKLGYEIVHREYPPYGCSDFTPYLLGMKKANPDIIFWQGLNSGIICRDANRLGMVPPNPYFLCGLYNGYAVKDWYASEGGYDKWYWTNDRYLVDEGDGVQPGITKMCDVMEKYWGGRTNTLERGLDTATIGYEEAIAIRDVLKFTIERKGYPITCDDIVDTIINMPPWDPGINPGTYKWGPTERIGYHMCYVGRCVGPCKYENVSGWLTTPDDYIKAMPDWYGLAE